MRVDVTSYDDASRQVIDWARRSTPAYVCVANVHMVMEAYDSIEYRSFVNNADLVTPDGMPLVLGLRFLGFRNAERVYGPDLTRVLLRDAAARGLTVGFYGSSQDVLDELVARIRAEHPNLSIGLVYAPPFRTLRPSEDAEIVRRINDSGTQILFVGLGCPKQERWMAEHRDRVRPVMLGVGAAFDFLAGKKAQAPRWVMKLSLEWLFRLAAEPKRLWRRYLKQNPRFVFLFSLQLAGATRQLKGQL